MAGSTGALAQRAEAGSTKRVEVLNGGCSGWSTFESLANLSYRMVEFEPDLVIVYHTINDARCALYEPGGPIRMDNTQWREVYPRIVEAPGERLLEHSMTYLVLRSMFSDYVDRFDSLNTALIVNYDPKARDLYVRENPDERGFVNFRRNLTSIVAVARAHGAEVLLLTQACDEQDIGAQSRDTVIAGFAPHGVDPGGGRHRAGHALRRRAGAMEKEVAELEKQALDPAGTATSPTKST